MNSVNKIHLKTVIPITFLSERKMWTFENWGKGRRDAAVPLRSPPPSPSPPPFAGKRACIK